MVISIFLAATLATAAPDVAVSPQPHIAAGLVPASPSPCPTGVPNSGAPQASVPSPCPSSAAQYRTIGRVITVGRQANLVGKAISASTGTISQEQIATRPLLRPGEVLEDIPGLIISQHSGGGKANQYYLRGFQLDHGTNLDAEINGVPVNLGSRARAGLLRYQLSHTGTRQLCRIQKRLVLRRSRRFCRGRRL